MSALDLILATEQDKETGKTARAELAALRAKADEYDRIEDNEHCPLCTWRGPVELDNGICPQCGVDWPKSYREYRDAPAPQEQTK